MSNLLKSKFLLGVLVVAILVVGGVAFLGAGKASADCTITSTLKLGSKGTQVVCLQSSLGLTADGSFGPKTLAGVKAWQTNAGLVADGIFGAKSRAAFTSSTVTTTYPAGCTSASGYSPTTGAPCTGVVTTTYPAGCTSSAGYSSTTGASCSTGVISSATGPVSASLASDTPASGYIIANQATADLAHFAFSGVGTVNTLVLQRTGVSDQNTLSNLYLYDGAVRLTDGYSFNNTGQLTMNSLGIAINGSKVISVKADIALVTNASSLGITLVGYTAAGNAAVTANIKGNEMTYGVGNLASAYLGANPSAGTAKTVNAGTSAYTVWSSALQVNTRAVWLKGANLRIIGSAPSDALGNIKLYVDGVAVGSTATIGTITGSTYAMFDFSAAPVSLTTGTHTVDLRADVVKGSSYTVTVSIQQASDLVIYDAQVGVNIAALGPAGVAFTSNSGAEITINAGSASVVIDPTFQSLTNITGGATNALIGKFKVHGYGEDVKVSTLVVLPIMGGTPTLASGVCTANVNCSLNNVTVYFNGSQVGSSQNWTGLAATTLSFTLGSQMIIPAGTDSYIEVRGDLQNASSINYTGGTVAVQLNGLTGNSQGQTSHTTINFPGATLTNVVGTALTIQTGTLAVSKNTGYASQSVGPNTANTKIGSYVLQNQSTSESVRVTSFAIGLTRSDGTTVLTNLGSATVYPALTNFSNLKTSETSGSGATPIQPSAANTFSVDFLLAPGATKVIDVLADTSSTAASAAFNTNLVVTSLGSSSNVSILQNATGTAVTGQIMTLAVGLITNSISLGTLTTAQQFVPAAGGATNATKAVFKIAATGGSAVISEMKFTVNSQDFSSTGTYSAIAAGAATFTPAAGHAADADRFAVGDVVQIVASTTNGLGTVTAITGTTSVTVTITVAATGTGSALRLVPATVTAIKVGNVSAAPVGGIAYLTGLNLTVPNGGSGLSQDVFISYAEVGTNGVVSGSTSRVALEYLKYTSGNTTSTLCTPEIAACDTAMTTMTVAAPTMKMVGSAPGLSLAGSTSRLVIGSIDIGNITVSANAKGDITLNALPISVTILNATLTNANPGYNAQGIRVKDKDGNPVTTTNGAFTNTTTGGTSTIAFTNGYQIPAGTSQTFHVFLTFDGVTALTASATMGLGTADLLSWTDTAGNALATNSIDVAGSAATTLANRYLNLSAGTGFFYNYPTNTVNVNNAS